MKCPEQSNSTHQWQDGSIFPFNIFSINWFFTSVFLYPENVIDLKSGTYIIKASCSNGCETAVQKFVKQ